MTDLGDREDKTATRATLDHRDRKVREDKTAIKALVEALDLLASPDQEAKSDHQAQKVRWVLLDQEEKREIAEHLLTQLKSWLSNKG